jgi:UDPglucose--hexose-1-phosphate uridylyltransferase
VRDPESAPNTPGWKVRVVPNRFPALRVEGALNKEAAGIYDMMSGVGAHEVIIETPQAGVEMEDLELEDLAHVLKNLSGPHEGFTAGYPLSLPDGL